VTVVVGVGPETPPAVWRLAEQVAAGRSITLCGVVLDPWDGPALATVAEPGRHILTERTQQALTSLRSQFGTPDVVSTSVRQGVSIPEELLAEARDSDAQILVVGSSRRAAMGRVALGSVSDQLVHSATLPVALPPRDFIMGGQQTIDRLVVGLQPSDGPFAAGEISELALTLGVDVELVTFGVSPWPQGMHVDEIEWEGMFNSWRRQVAQMQQEVADDMEAMGISVSARHHIDAYRWAQAIGDVGWRAGDMLALFSSRRGPVSRVFLGSTAARILRHTPVPTVVLPRRSRPGDSVDTSTRETP